MYQVYISNNCPTCDRVLEYLNNNSNLKFETLNIRESADSGPFPIYIVPALIKGEKLLAYGDDIISYFQKKKPA